MFAATRRWFRRNRAPIAITVGVVSAGYVVTQYVLSKLNDARERMSSERIAKENLRRRFEQNQEDCAFTVLALLPTATANILEAMNTESITIEIQQIKGGAGAAKAAASRTPPSIADTNLTDEDGRSMASLQSESGVHASQVALPPSSPAAGEGEQAKPRKTKRQLWSDLTISSITRAYTLIYTLGLLSMLTRIQLNLLGRRSYLSSVVSLATGPGQAAISLENHDDDASVQAGDDFETNRRYLTFSWWLLNRGWTDIMARVEAAVRDVFGPLSPRDQVTFETVAGLTARVRRAVEGGDPQTQQPRTNWLPYLLPPPDMEDYVLRESGILDDSAASLTQSAPPTPLSPTSATSLRRLLDETSDLAESPAFSHVLAQLLDAGFAHLLDRKLAHEAYELPPPPAPAEAAATAEWQRLRSGKQVLLPRVLSVLAKQAHAIGSGMPNEYLQMMEQVRDLEAFAAVVYSSNWENEVRDDGLMASAVDLGRQAEAAVGGPAQAPRGPARGTTDESLVLVDPQASFESAWERATEPA